MAELIALLKAKPGKFNYASSGHGAAAHLAGELFKAEAKVDIVHVPYKGAAPALTRRDRRPRANDVRHRRVRGAAYPERQGARAGGDAAGRTAVFPELATMDELGTQGLRRHHLAWSGRAGEDAARNRSATASCHRRGAERSGGAQIARRLGVDIVGNTPEEFAAYIKAEIPKWTAIVKASGARLD